jgi:hypothetical protein
MAPAEVVEGRWAAARAKERAEAASIWRKARVTAIYKSGSNDSSQSLCQNQKEVDGRKLLCHRV